MYLCGRDLRPRNYEVFSARRCYEYGKPYSLSILVNDVRKLYLLTSLDKIFLICINTECIEQPERNQQITTPSRSSGQTRPFLGYNKH